jgi:ABC-type bacteriocin/lantibiotic exporter with double-glycine peptidase domain
MTPLKRFLALLSLERKRIYYIYIYAIFSGLVTLTLPLGIQAILSQLESQEITSAWTILVAVVIVGIIAAGVLKIMQLYLSEFIQRRIFVRASLEFAYRLPRIKFSALREHHAPELVNRFFDTLTIQKGLSKILIDFSTSAIQILFGLLLLSLYHPVFIAFGAILLMILFFIIRLTGPSGLNSSLEESRFKYEVAHWLEEVARTMGTFKLSGCVDLPLVRADMLTEKYLAARKDHFRILIFQFSSFVGFKTLITGGLLVLGSILVVNQQITIGQFVASEIVIILIMESVQKLILSMETVYDVLTSVEKIGYVTDLELETSHGSTMVEQAAEHQAFGIQLRELSFKYELSDNPVLDKVNLDISPGSRVCVGGYNGSGKTTLLQLIAGLYDHYDGNILYNGLPLKNLDIYNLRFLIGDTLTQESLFYGTLEENISMGRADVGIKQVIEASDEVGLTSFIQRMPMGYDTLIKPSGKDLSDSVIRRIILARGIVTRPRLLLLDEDIFQFESAEQRKLIRWLSSPDRPWTLVAVSNDIDVARMADKVVILDQGRVKMEGTFEELSGIPEIGDIFKFPER